MKNILITVMIIANVVKDFDSFNTSIQSTEDRDSDQRYPFSRCSSTGSIHTLTSSANNTGEHFMSLLIVKMFKISLVTM